MCDKCFSEINEEIALKNGAENWHKRKDVLAVCRDTHDIHLRNHITPNCDKCDETVNISVPYYAKREADYDFCGKCCTENPSLIADNDLRKTQTSESEIEMNNHFGNILDWVPLYLETPDEEEAYILQCLNPANSFYRRFSLACCDDHGRALGLCVQMITESFAKQLSIVLK